MKDSLEDFVNENRESFDADSPSAGHMDRFKTMLNAQASEDDSENDSGKDRKVVTLEVRKLWQFAAAVAVLIAVALGVWMNIGDETQPVIVDNTATVDQNIEPTALQEISPEMAEVEDYFIQTVSQRVQEVDSYNASEEPFVVNCLQQLETLETEYAELKKDLSVNYNDERIVNSMIQNYRMRLRVLDQLLLQLEMTNKRKTQDYEEYQL